MSVHLPSNKLTLNLTEFTKKKKMTELTKFLVDLAIFTVVLTKIMSAQNRVIKLSIWRAIWSFCKVDFF